MSVILLTPGNLSLFLSYDGIVDDNFTLKCLKRVAICGFLGHISTGWNKIKDILDILQMTQAFYGSNIMHDIFGKLKCETDTLRMPRPSLVSIAT